MLRRTSAIQLFRPSSLVRPRLFSSTSPKLPKIFVTRRIPGSAVEELKKHFEVKVNPHDRVLTKTELIKELRDKHALLCLLTDTVDSEVINSAPNLKGISSFNVGLNNIDVKEATRKGIPVCYMSDVSSKSTADLTFALLLSVARRVVETDQFTRAGLFQGWKPDLLLGTEVHGKTLGIVGFGNIGQAVARRAQGFDMKILYTARSNKKHSHAEFVTLDDCLKHSDFISLHTPLTPETHHLIGKRELALMKKSAFLINTSRGSIIDEAALLDALQRKIIAGAGLDVYENEPLLMPGLTKLSNIVLTPHIGSSTVEARNEMSCIAAENIIAIFAGRKPRAIANPEVLACQESKVNYK